MGANMNMGNVVFSALLFFFFAFSISYADSNLCVDADPSSDALLFSQYCGSNKTTMRALTDSSIERQKYPKTLLSKLSQGDRVNIIVKLKANFLPEGLYKTEENRTRQRDSIKMAQEGFIKRYPVKNIKAFPSIPFVALEADYTLLNKIAEDPLVELIKEDKLSKPMLSQSVPIIRGNDAWNKGYTGSGQSIAILDSGVQKSHPFLSNKVIDEACYSTSNSYAKSLCPNGSDSQIGDGAGVNCSGISGCKHGTHIAGIAAGKGEDFSGVARDANIISIQVFSRFDNSYHCDDNPPCILSYDSDQLMALERVYELRNTYKISAVNMSLGGGWYGYYCDSEESDKKAIIDNLRSVGIATVIAAGNDGYTDGINAPACISTAISVGATTKSDMVATSYSNSALFLSLLAPGSSIYSSVPTNQFGYSTGTSMAAPHVAGAWAVVKQKIPSVSVTQLLSLLQNSGKSITDPRNGITKSRIDVLSALNYLAVPVYRFYNTQAGGHFFTVSESERDDVRNNLKQFNYEGIGFYAYSSSNNGAVPVYRFYNTQAGGHFFTVSESERDYVRNNLKQFNYEGIGFYAYSSSNNGAVPVFRFFNTQAGGHFFTISETERDDVRNNLKQFNYEGIGFYALP